MNFINALSETDALIPVIVCGAARSGTRMVTDLLNTHEKVAIQNEMHAGTVEAYFDMLATVKDTFSVHSAKKGKFLGAGWEIARRRLTHAFFTAACKKGASGLQKNDLRYHGIKTPGFERYFIQFEDAFAGSSPKYIYCIRSVDKVWKSWMSLGYLDDVEVFQRRYKRSLRQAKTIKRTAPDRFILFDLDAFVASEDKLSFVETHLFSPLGIMDSRTYGSSLISTPNRNALNRTRVKPVSGDKLEQQMRMLRESIAIQQLRMEIGAISGS